MSLNKPASAISVWGEGMEADKVNDGDNATRWASQGHEDEAKWIYIDLEDKFDIDSVKILWEDAYGKDFTIDVSDDATTWITAKTVTGNASSGLQNFTDLSAQGRYVRVYITAGVHAHVSIFEFSVYGTEHVIDPVSLNKPTTAISVWGEGMESDKVNDGDNATRWASKGHADEPKWIYIDLEENYSIDSVLILWEAAYGTDFTIDISDDATNWTVAKTIMDNGSDGLQSITDIAGAGRYVRINITAGVHDHASIYEFSVYGSVSNTSDVKNYLGNADGIKVYPNPTANMVTVQTSNGSKAKLSVYELSGKLVYSDEFISNKVVNAKELGGSGILLIRVETETKTFSKKLIVE